MILRPVVFLDRDGTLNVEKGYIRRLEELELINGAGSAVLRLNKAGIAAVLVTNQSGAARGFYPESHIQRLNSRLSELLSYEGAHLDAMYYCPHWRASEFERYAIECACRKPGTGMIEKALLQLSGLDRERAYVIGDKLSDLELACNCKMKGILVTSGYGQNEISQSPGLNIRPEYVASSIVEAVDHVLEDLGIASV